MVAYTPDIEYVLPSMLLLLTDLIWSHLKNYEAISWAIPASVETPRASDQTGLKRSLWMPPLLQISYISQTLSGLTSWPFYKHSWDFSVFKTSLYHPICMYFSHTQKRRKLPKQNPIYPRTFAHKTPWAWQHLGFGQEHHSPPSCENGQVITRFGFGYFKCNFPQIWNANSHVLQHSNFITCKGREVPRYTQTIKIK